MKTIPISTRIALAILVGVNLVCLTELAGQSVADKISLTVTYSDGEKLKLYSKSGPFPFVGVGAGETVDFSFELPERFGNVPLVLQALDGGTVSPTDFAGGKNKISAVFRVGLQPGLYRILLIGGEQRAMLRFWVPNVDDPASNPAVITPESEEVAR